MPIDLFADPNTLSVAEKIEYGVMMGFIMKIQATARRFLQRSKIYKSIAGRYEKILDPKRKRYYYYDVLKDASSWHKPRLLLKFDLEVAPTYTTDQGALFIQKHFWRLAALRRVRKLYKETVIATKDEKSGDTYYFNPMSGMTFWELPKFMGGKLDWKYKDRKGNGEEEDEEKEEEPYDSDSSDDSLDSEAKREKKRLKRKYPRSKAQIVVDAAVDFIKQTRAINLSGMGIVRCSSRIYDINLLEKLDVSYNKFDRISKDISYLSNLQDINICHNLLTKIPKEFGELAKLKRLNMSHNQLSDFYGTFWKCNKLEVLDFSYNKFVEMPMEVGNLELLKELHEWEVGLGQLLNITDLNISHNSLLKWPAQLERLGSVSTLRLNHNRIDEVPETVADNVCLSVVDLSWNAIKSISAKLFAHPLTELHLNNNQLQELPTIENPGKNPMRGLLKVNLSNNKIGALKEVLSTFTMVKDFDASHNYIASISPGIGEMKALVNLNFSYNKIAAIPGDLAKCKGIIELNLSCNLLSNLPMGISALKGLKILIASHNLIVEADEKIFADKLNLEKLDLHNNRLNRAPATLFALRRLKTLDLSYNKLVHADYHMRDMNESLVYLNLSNNLITKISDSVSTLTKLTYLGLECNKLTILPESIGTMTQLTHISLKMNDFEATPLQLLKLPRLVQWTISWSERVIAYSQPIDEIDDIYIENQHEVYPLWGTFERLIDAAGIKLSLTTAKVKTKMDKYVPTYALIPFDQTEVVIDPNHRPSKLVSNPLKLAALQKDPELLSIKSSTSAASEGPRGAAKLRIHSIQVSDLIDKGHILDVQDPAVKIKVGGKTQKTARQVDKGKSASFPEEFTFDYDDGKDLQLEVEAINESSTGKGTLLGKGSISIKSLIKSCDRECNIEINLSIGSKVQGKATMVAILSAGRDTNQHPYAPPVLTQLDKSLQELIQWHGSVYNYFYQNVQSGYSAQVRDGSAMSNIVSQIASLTKDLASAHTHIISKVMAHYSFGLVGIRKELKRKYARVAALKRSVLSTSHNYPPLLYRHNIEALPDVGKLIGIDLGFSFNQCIRDYEKLCNEIHMMAMKEYSHALRTEIDVLFKNHSKVSKDRIAMLKKANIALSESEANFEPFDVNDVFPESKFIKENFFNAEVEETHIPYFLKISHFITKSSVILPYALEIYAGLATAILRRTDCISYAIRSIERDIAKLDVKYVSKLNFADRQHLDYDDLCSDRMGKLKKVMEKQAKDSAFVSISQKKQDKVAYLLSLAADITANLNIDEVGEKKKEEEKKDDDDGKKKKKKKGAKADAATPAADADKAAEGEKSAKADPKAASKKDAKAEAKPPAKDNKPDGKMPPVSAPPPATTSTSSAASAASSTDILTAADVSITKEVVEEKPKSLNERLSLEEKHSTVSLLLKYRELSYLMSYFVLEYTTTILQIIGFAPLNPEQVIEDEYRITIRTAIRVFLMRAKYYQGVREYNKAIDDYRAALSLSKGKFHPVYPEMCKCFIAQGNYPSAIDIILTLIPKDMTYRGDRINDTNLLYEPVIGELYKRDKFLAYCVMFCASSMENIFKTDYMTFEQVKKYNVAMDGLLSINEINPPELVTGYKFWKVEKILAEKERVDAEKAAKKAAEIEIAEIAARVVSVADEYLQIVQENRETLVGFNPAPLFEILAPTPKPDPKAAAKRAENDKK